MTETARLLRELIARPSVNPAFVPAGDVHAGERRVADFITDVARAAGLDVERRNVLPGRPNVIARLAPTGTARHCILLAPHLDTVPAADKQFVPRLKNGRLFGRGASDTKGSIAAMLVALSEIAASPNRPRETEIVFAGLMDEEHSQAGSRALVASGFKADLAVVGEPTRARVVTAHKGSLWLELATRGKSAHGSRPELGRNAVHSMAKVVHALETEYAAALRKRRHTLLGCATVNVGTIRGGTQPNVVPENCTITVDRRTLPGETEASVRREVIAFLARRNLRVTFNDLQPVPCLALETDPTLPLVRLFLRIAGQREPAGVNFFCDAAVLSAGGIPSVVFGPGDIGQGHTADEWISLASLERAKDILRKFLGALP
jgi:acetylornithine deacetylase/succinyl-diaminopimelate desuccinylase family protein